MISDIYEYAELTRVEENGARQYVTPDGLHVPSVTTVLGQTADKSHLEAWKKRVGHNRAADIVAEASSIGTRMHKFLEDYARTDVWSTPGSHPYSIQANKMAKNICDNAFKHIDQIWGLEVHLFNDQLYAGTTDLIAVYKGRPSICDFKQSNRLKKSEWVDDYRLQLVAYAECHNRMHGTDIMDGHIFMCTRDLEYQQFDIGPDEFAYWRNIWYDRLYQYYELYGK